MITSNRFWWKSNCSFRSAWITRLHDILDSAVFTACVLAYLLIMLPGSVVKSALHNFPFLTMFIILFLLGRLAFMVTSAALWNRLYERCQGQVIGWVHVKCTEATCAFLALKPHLDTRAEGHQASRKSTGGASTSSTYPMKNGCHGGQCSCCVTVNIFIILNFIYCAAWYTSKNFR